MAAFYVKVRKMQPRKPHPHEENPRPPYTEESAPAPENQDVTSAPEAQSAVKETPSDSQVKERPSPVKAPARLLRAGTVTAAMTFLSRILGMVRDMAIASLLGAGLMADVFFFANRIPNFLRRLFAEGAFSQAFVPVLSKTREKGAAGELKDLIGATAGTLGAVVLVICAVGMVASPVVTALFGLGWYQAYVSGEPDGEKFLEASYLLQITFPYLFFITLTALCAAVLNVFGKFAIPAVTPCILNVVMIVTALCIAPRCDDPNAVLAMGMVAGGVAQLLFVLPALMRLKLLTLPRLAWRHPGVAQIRRLMLPGILGTSAAQLNLLVNTVLASFLATGAISYLYYSDRLLEFPIGIFAVAISTVILPALSRLSIKENPEKYQQTLDWGVRLVLLLGIPSALGMVALRESILRVIFMRGAFTAEHVSFASASLLASVSGLTAIMLVRVLIQGFAALQDTKTPVRCALVAIIANILFNLLLVWPLGYVGLALSTALAAYVNVGQLIYLLHKRKIYTPGRNTLLFFIKTLVAGGVMCATVRYVSFTPEEWVSMETLPAILYLALFIGLGALIYGALCLLLGIRPRHIRM